MTISGNDPDLIIKKPAVIPAEPLTAHASSSKSEDNQIESVGDCDGEGDCIFISKSLTSEDLIMEEMADDSWEDDEDNVTYDEPTENVLGYIAGFIAKNQRERFFTQQKNW